MGGWNSWFRNFVVTRLQRNVLGTQTKNSDAVSDWIEGWDGNWKSRRKIRWVGIHFPSSSQQEERKPLCFFFWSKKMSGFSYSHTLIEFLRNRLFSPSWVSPGVVCRWTPSMLYGVGFQKKPRADACSHLCCRADTCSHLSCRIPVFLHFCTGVQFLRDCLPLWNIILMFLALIFCRNPLVRCQTTSAEVLVLAGRCRATWILKGPFYIQLHFVQTDSVHQSISAKA